MIKNSLFFTCIVLIFLFQNCSDQKDQHQKYIGEKILFSSCDKDTLKANFVFVDSSLYLVNNAYYTQDKVLFLYKMFNFTLDVGDTFQILSPIVVGAGNSHLLTQLKQNWGYVVVLLQKDKDVYHFKHRAVRHFGTPRPPEENMDSTLYTVNQKVPFEESYFKISFHNSDIVFKDYCRIGGIFPLEKLPY